MRKYIILTLSFYAPLQCMENFYIPSHRIKKQIVKHEPREWNAKTYNDNKGNIVQADAFLQFLKQYDITTENRTIVDVGCGPGPIAAKLAMDGAIHVHGFDASKNMIDFAQNKYGNIKNLTFEHCFAEDFTSPIQRDLALASFCIHWFENKQQALRSINKSLKIGGEFFGTFQSSDNEPPFNLVAAQELINKFFFFLEWFGINPTGSSYPSTEEYHTMLKENGFEIIESKEQFFGNVISKDELQEALLVIASSTPLMKYIPDIFVQPLLDYYMELCLSKLSKTEDEKFSYKIFTTIIHARKVKEYNISKKKRVS